MSAEHERRAVLLHAATLVVQLLAWVTCSRGRAPPRPALRAIDATALVLACLGFALQFGDRVLRPTSSRWARSRG